MKRSACQNNHNAVDLSVDKVAIGVSLLCIVHCVGSLMVLALLTGAGGLFLSESVHHIGLLIAILLGSLALGLGFRYHRQPGPMTMGIAGLGLMSIALMVDHGWPEALLTIAGTSMLALGHWRNMQAHRAGRCSH